MVINQRIELVHSTTHPRIHRDLLAYGISWFARFKHHPPKDNCFASGGICHIGKCTRAVSSQVVADALPVFQCTVFLSDFGGRLCNGRVFDDALLEQWPYETINLSRHVVPSYSIQERQIPLDWQDCQANGSTSLQDRFNDPIQILVLIAYLRLTNLICMNLLNSFSCLPGTDKTSTRSSALFCVTDVFCTIGFPLGSLASVFQATDFDSLS